LQSFVGLTLVVLIFVGYQVFFRSDTAFLSPFRLTLIAKQTAIVGMGALGMTVIIISAGIDLSSGSMLALSAVTLALALRAGVPPIWSAVLVLAAGTAAGAINGLLITGLRLVPFIVTLGTMLAYRGLAEQIASQNKIPVPNAPDWLAGLLDPPAKGSWQLVATGVWLVIVLGIVLTGVMWRTVFGRHVVAIGSNETAARLCGIRAPQIKVAVYAIGGLFMALAGIFSFSDLNKQGDPGTGVGLELDIIAAVVIGGGSLNGGRGSVLGSIIGALTMTVLRSGCVYAGISDPIQRIVIGAIIVGAVAIDQFSQRRGRQV
jgi:ribose transport system permease protein